MARIFADGFEHVSIDDLNQDIEELARSGKANAGHTLGEILTFVVEHPVSSPAGFYIFCSDGTFEVIPAAGNMFVVRVIVFKPK